MSKFLKTLKLTFRHLFSLETDIFIFKEQEQREMLRITWRNIQAFAEKFILNLIRNIEQESE